MLTGNISLTTCKRNKNKTRNDLFCTNYSQMSVHFYIVLVQHWIWIRRILDFSKRKTTFGQCFMHLDRYRILWYHTQININIFSVNYLNWILTLGQIVFTFTVLYYIILYFYCDNPMAIYVLLMTVELNLISMKH